MAVSVAGGQSHIGSARRVVDLVVGLVTQGNYRSARLHLHSLELRQGLSEAAEIIGRITAPPPGVDPRTESQARLNVPDMLPPWLLGPVHEEIARICARQSVRAATVPHLVARILAASIVDASAPGQEVAADFVHRAHVDLRDDAPAAGIPADTVVDVSDGRGSVEPAEVAAPADPDRSITDWLGRRR
jgi:hypothetical protein